MAGTRRRQIAIYYEGEETGGVTGVIESLLPGVCSDFDVSLVVRSTPAVESWSRKLSSSQVTVHPIALRNRQDLLGWFDWIRIWRLRSVFHRSALNHFHQHTPFSCIPAVVLAKVASRGPVVTTEHYITQLRHLRRRRRRFLVALVRELRLRLLLGLKKLSLRCVDRVVFVSEANRKYFLEVFGQSYEQRTVVIPNGIPAEKFQEPSNRQRDDIAGFPMMDCVSHLVAVVAGLNNQKGHEFLIRAVPLVLKRCPDVHFLFVGEGHLRQQLEKLVEALALGDHIHFLGARKDVADILRASDLFVLPSLFEGMPLSVLEAMAAGRAVVATDVDGTAEVVMDGKSGFLVPPKDSRLLAEKITQLLADEGLRAQFGRAGRERLIGYFSLARSLDRHRELYRELIGRSGGTP